MKKAYRLSFTYLIMGLIGGVFYREFTKFNNFVGVTQLSVLHTHLLMLGMFMMLIVLILVHLFKIDEHKDYKRFMGLYNGGLHLTVIMMVVRGITQVLNTNLSKGMNAAISGMAGLGHILMGTGLIYLFIILKKQCNIDEKN